MRVQARAPVCKHMLELLQVFDERESRAERVEVREQLREFVKRLRHRQQAHSARRRGRHVLEVELRLEGVVGRTGCGCCGSW